ncbi:helix-turn-helix domain-containing protein [Larkinella bovis]|uniref:Helix-turn-helix domain-containing protein n=1 Tax=Larkinella bovis TaxID=683041 RepID=A0ABW0IA77_9BACT
MQRFLPADPLKPFVRAYLLIESATGTENRVVPDTSIVLAFRYKGAITQHTHEGQPRDLPFSAITGLRKSSRLIRYASDTATLLVLFREGGAAAFFREPLHELFGLSLSLDELIGRRALAETEERLAEAQNHAQRIALVERFLVARLRSAKPEHRVNQAVSILKTAHGHIGIKSLAQSLWFSQDAFEKQFRRAVGASPKQFASILRFRHLIESHAADRSLTDLAYEAGYFDQAHFIKDFRSFTGQTPKAFFKTGRFW